jgi:hypothetical protein
MNSAKYSGGSVVVGLLCVGVFAAACGGPTEADPGDAGDAGAVPIAHRDTGPADVVFDMPDARSDRMSPHGREILANMHLRVVYVGEEGVDGPPNIDDFVTWLVKSDYWGVMKEYGVQPGTFEGSVRIPTASVFLPGMVQNGLVDYDVLDQRILALLHPPPRDAGAGAGDAGAPLIPPSKSYLFMLPDRVNVKLGGNDQTCIQAGGYHSHDSKEPYSVIPPCNFGRSALAISHELAEMATDPLPQYGWYSDKDAQNAGGEIGDLCNQPIGVEGWSVTQLWSNKNGACIPAY